MNQSKSRQVVLTIDDGPTEITPQIVDFLRAKEIKAVMFFPGDKMEQRPEVVKYAMRAGMDIGNHSYSHPYFSELSFEECAEQILRTEDILNRIYESLAAEGIARRHKVFRFPYGDKGGEHKDRLQDLLEKSGFENLALYIDHAWYTEAGMERDRDIYWTFDYKDYKISNPEHEFELDDVWAHMAEDLQAELSNEILLFHDHIVTNEKYPRYYEQLIHRTESMGLVFTQPSYQ
ncbi:MAG: polysaccharide deacetylase family protein [Spirochaetota bacterium]